MPSVTGVKIYKQQSAAPFAVVHLRPSEDPALFVQQFPQVVIESVPYKLVLSHNSFTNKSESSESTLDAPPSAALPPLLTPPSQPPYPSYTARALFDYTGPSDDYATLKSGDIVTVLETSPNGWCRVISNSREVFAPQQYLQPV